ncbi:anti-sigma factor family protein [Nocardioides sp. LML1-1-1.1]|uniref:anti-sigma factor family protein n=1 Tax=Nocardioides sp. LML1-1-1.1 TaxID=3135248 RepID=UPI003424CB6D
MIGHLGTRVSALLDGQLSAKETEEAWAHVYACHACRDLVEREGWVKTRLAAMCGGDREAPSGLKGSLMSMPPGDALAAPVHEAGRRTGAVMIGGSAVGAAILGVVALGFVSGSAPPSDRRPPVTQINSSVPSTPATPSGSSTPWVPRPGQPIPIGRVLP